MNFLNRQIHLFQSLFKGREDLYARRWVKGDKIGYFEKLFKKRNQFYNKIRKANQITLDF